MYCNLSKYHLTQTILSSLHLLHLLGRMLFDGQMASRKYGATTCWLIWSVGVILIFLIVRTTFLPLLALLDNVLYLTLLNSASCCCRCLIFWSCSSITEAYDGSMLTFLNGLSAGYNDPVDVDECVVVSESFIRLIWFMMSEIAMFYVFRKKWGFVWSYVCWSVLIQSNYGGVVIIGRESDLCANNMTWFKCDFCLILSNDLLI